MDENQMVLIYPDDSSIFKAKPRAESNVAEYVPIFEARTKPFTSIGENGEFLDGSDGTILTVLDGWDTYVGVELVTVPKLNAPGSYVESRHLAERELAITASILKSSMAKTREVSDAVMTEMLEGTLTGRFVKLFVADFEEDEFGNDVVTKMSMLERCQITGLSDWTQTEKHAYITISVTCLEPVKKWEKYSPDGEKTTGTSL
jgi:hypothetical protein